MFLKIRTNKKAIGGVKTIYLAVIQECDNFILGRPINPKTAEDLSTTKRDGTIVDRQHFVSKGAIAWVEELRQNRKYGNLELVEIRRYINPDRKVSGCHEMQPGV